MNSLRTYKYILVFLLLIFIGGSVYFSGRTLQADSLDGVVTARPMYPTDLKLIDVGTVTNIVKSNLIEVDSKKGYRLSQIRVPVKYELEALDYLKKNILGKKVGFYSHKGLETSPKDRYGNIYAHVLLENGSWLQADLIAQGFSWAFSAQDQRILTAPLRSHENMARKLRNGFWKDPEFAIKNKRNIKKYVNSYQIYQGLITHAYTNSETGKHIILLGVSRVQDSKNYQNTSFLNIEIDKKNDSPFINTTRQGFRPVIWVNSYVRVHGWVQLDKVPTIEVTHPEQIEFVDTEGQGLQ